MLENKNNSWLFLLPLIIMSVVAIALFLFFGINRSTWLDEALCVITARHDFEGIIHKLECDAHPPLYYFVLSVWTRAFGISELAIRSLSGIFYILSLAAIYVLGKAVYNDKRTGLLCSFLYMLSPLAIKHAQNARPYSLLGLLVILSTLFFFRLFIIKTDSKKDLALYIIVNIIGTFTHYWFFFVIISQIVFHLLLFFRLSFKKFSVAIIISVTPFFLLWTPTLLSQLSIPHLTSWMGKPGIHKLGFTLSDFCGGLSWKRAVPVYSVFLALIVLKIEGFKIKFWGITNLKGFIIQKQNLAFLIFLSVSLSVPFIISQAKPIYWPRYTIIALPPFVMLVGSLLSRFGNKYLILACCYILLVETSVSFVSFRTTPTLFTDKSTTEYLIKHADNNDVLIFTHLSQPPIDYYLRLMKPDNGFIKISFPSEIALRPCIALDINKILSQKDMLENEADSIVSRIEDILTKNNDTKVWLLLGGNVEIGEILKDKLDTHFFLREVKDLDGGLHYILDDHKFSLRENEVASLRRPFYNYTFWDDARPLYSQLLGYQIKPWKKDTFYR